MIQKVSAEDIAIRGNGTGLEYMCPTRHFVYIFFNPVFQVSTAKNEINLFNNHILIVAPVTFAPAGAMTPSAEFLFNFTTLWANSADNKLISYFSQKTGFDFFSNCLMRSPFAGNVKACFLVKIRKKKKFNMSFTENFTCHAKH